MPQVTSPFTSKDDFHTPRPLPQREGAVSGSVCFEPLLRKEYGNKKEEEEASLARGWARRILHFTLNS